MKNKTDRFFDHEMSEHAKAFTQAKKVINMTDAHASLRSAQFIVGQSASGGDLFFDAENPVLERVGLWSVINTTIGVFDAYYLVAQRYGGIKFADGFGDVFAAVLDMHDRLHGELWGNQQVQALGCRLGRPKTRRWGSDWFWIRPELATVSRG